MTKYNGLESIVIVTNQYGSIATIRLKDSSKDRIISANTKASLHLLIDKYIDGVFDE